ncbi:hypothetical protein F5887DRAFT_28599 [Amanita rubescens]|nr:hypothetical protein F5887DRAFT_28599 [Amanita rubescens]
MDPRIVASSIWQKRSFIGNAWPYDSFTARHDYQCDMGHRDTSFRTPEFRVFVHLNLRHPPRRSQYSTASMLYGFITFCPLLITFASTSVMSTPSSPTSYNTTPVPHVSSPNRPSAMQVQQEWQLRAHLCSSGHCDYFQWLSDPLPVDTSSCSTPRSTSPTSSESSGNGAPHATLTIRVLPLTSVGPLSQLSCTLAMYKSTRIHPDCFRKVCRRHCIANGNVSPC